MGNPWAIAQAAAGFGPAAGAAASAPGSSGTAGDSDHVAPPRAADRHTQHSHDDGSGDPAPGTSDGGRRRFTRAVDSGSTDAADRPEGTGPQRKGNPRLERFGERTEDFVDSVNSAFGKAVPKKVHRRRDPRQNTVVNVTWRALVLLVGLSFVCLGIALLVLPGPGWGSILLGLAILASEYTWANRLMTPVRRRVRAEAARVRRLSRRQQMVVTGLTVVASLTAIGVGIWYITTNGIPWPW